jgi:hypothetical protein
MFLDVLKEKSPHEGAICVLGGSLMCQTLFLVNSMYIEMENANSFHIRNCMDSEGLN